MSTSEAIAITGAGAVTAVGVGAKTLTDRWLAGECGIEDGCAACRDFDPHEYLGRKEVRRTDRFTQLALVAGDDALGQAGWLSGTPYEPERVACMIGTGIGGVSTLETEYTKLMARGAQAISPLTIPMMMPNSPAGYMVMRHGWRGSSYAVSAACATGGHAIAAATRMIQVGDADAVVVGASDAGITPLGLGAFEAMGAVSPSGRSLPFDARRDGFVMGEGAGTLILERAENAKARGAQILGEILGYGTTTDAYHITAPDPQAHGATRAIQLALKDAHIKPSQITYVNAHGTGTELNDRSETIALKQALGPHAHTTPISSTKSAIGHLLGAAGVVEAVATIHALRKNQLGPTTGYEQPDPDLDLDYIPHTRPLPTNHKPHIALSNAFGFGGHNVVICLQVNPELAPSAGEEG